MRAVAGVIPFTDRVIEVARHNVRTASLQAKAALAYAPDAPALFGSLTVCEHLVLAARAYAIADYQTRAEDLLRQFQLSDRRDTLAQELSRGARQKVAICAARSFASRNACRRWLSAAGAGS